MSDLIKRLRAMGAAQRPHIGDEAADEIERLQRRIDVLHEHDGTMCPLCAMEAEIERLEDQLSFMTKECRWFEVRYRNKIQEDENERLRDAVKALLRERDYVMDYVYDPNLDEVHALVNDALAALEDENE